MRALAAALMLTACATPTEDAPDFSYLAGCWISARTIEHWAATPDGGARAAVEWREGDCIADQAGFGACLITIEQEADGWRYRYNVTDLQHSYRLEHWSPRSATFRAEGHPFRPPLDQFLVIRLDGDRRLLVVEVTRGVEQVRFDGERCSGQ